MVTRLVDVNIAARSDTKVVSWDAASSTHVYVSATAATLAGRIHYVLFPGYDLTVTLVTGGNLGINGGSFAQAIYIPALMQLDTFRYRNNDSATTRSIEFGLFRDDGTANAVCVAKGTDSFTPSGASNRTPQLDRKS